MKIPLFTQTLAMDQIDSDVQDDESDIEDEDRVKYSPLDLLTAVEGFLSSYLPYVNCSNLPAKSELSRTREAREKCGYDILCQVMYMAYFRAYEKASQADKTESILKSDPSASKKGKKSLKILAPETCALVKAGAALNPLTCKIVPETQSEEAKEENKESSDDEEDEEMGRVSPIFDSKVPKKAEGFGARFKDFDQEETREEKVNLIACPDKEKKKTSPRDITDPDEMERMRLEKYNPLENLQNDPKKRISNEGVLGNGTKPKRPLPKLRRSLVDDCELEDAEEESPSILRKAPKSRPQPSSAADVKKEESSDDFEDKDDDVLKIDNAAKGKTSKRIPDHKPRRNAKVTNRFGMEVDQVPVSELERIRRLKQRKMDTYFKTPKSGPSTGRKRKMKKKSESDEELRRVIEMSKESAKIEEETRQSQKKKASKKPRTALTDLPDNLDDSFDRLPEAKEKSSKPNFKYVGEVVRGKEARQRLEATDCPECREFYLNSKMTDQQLKEVLKECSRHRSASAAASKPDSPHSQWLDMGFGDEDRDANRTQVGEKLKSKKQRMKEWRIRKGLEKKEDKCGESEEDIFSK